MTAKFVWNELKKLVVLDHQINELKKQIKKEKTALEQIRTPLIELKKNHDEHSQVVRDSQKRLDSLDLSLNSLKQEEAKKRAMLDTLSQPSQYQAMERELAEMERKTVGIELQMVTLLEQQEVAQKALESTAEQQATVEQEVEQASAETTALISEQEEQIESLQGQWEKQVSHVPSNLSKGYTEIRARVPNPVVPVVSSSCSACFYGLLHQDVVAMNNQTVIRCRGCYRFLFLPDAAPEQMAS